MRKDTTSFTAEPAVNNSMAKVAIPKMRTLRDYPQSQAKVIELSTGRFTTAWMRTTWLRTRRTE